MAATSKRIERALVDEIRVASRTIVRELGFLRTTLAATGLPASAVHAVLEIGAGASLTSTRLAELLQLDKSSISRMVGKLVDDDEVEEKPSGADGREKLLALTARGRRSRAAIETFGRRQVSGALARLTRDERQRVVRGLVLYAQALEAARRGESMRPGGIDIESGYRPGVIGRVVEMHASFYARQAGFGCFFERQVASGLAEFASRLDHRRNALWTARQEDRVVGSVVIDGEPARRRTAHLRWFIVDDAVRGTGAGRRLLEQAVLFCDRQPFDRIELWTFDGLDAARRLYERFGFELVEERPGRRWGEEVIEQRFVR